MSREKFHVVLVGIGCDRELVIPGCFIGGSHPDALTVCWNWDRFLRLGLLPATVGVDCVV